MQKLENIIQKFMEKQRRDEDIVRLRQLGKTYQSIGKQYGLTRQEVYFIVKQWNKEKVTK